MNENRLWYCDICDKKKNKKSKSKPNISQTHAHKETYGNVAQEFKFVNPDIDDVNYILNDAIKDCRKKYFHSLEYRCVYDFKFSNFTNHEEVVLSITLEYLK